MGVDRKMKVGLIVQSFAPLFLILLVKNFDIRIVTLTREFIEDYKSTLKSELFLNLLPNIIFVVFCIGILLWGLLSYASFNDSQNRDFKSRGEIITDVSNCNEVSITFFVTYIMPLSSDKVESFRDLLVFALIIGILYSLMYKTNLYYQNPILVILGYEIFKFRFKIAYNDELQDKEFIGISKEVLKDDMVIEWRHISDSVYIVYEDNISDAVRCIKEN